MDLKVREREREREHKRRMKRKVNHMENRVLFEDYLVLQTVSKGSDMRKERKYAEKRSSLLSIVTGIIRPGLDLLSPFFDPCLLILSLH